MLNCQDNFKIFKFGFLQRLKCLCDMTQECICDTYPNKENKSKKACKEMCILATFIYLFIYVLDTSIASLENG